jgi:hypothetical protein
MCAMDASAALNRLAILHIGPMKTGTTSIQSWLLKHRVALESRGIHVIKHSRSANMSQLAGMFKSSEVGSRRRRPAHHMSKDAFIAQLDQLSDAIHTCIISGELLGQTMKRAAISDLRRAMDPYFDKYLIILYLRRQVDLAVSRFSTISRKGRKGALNRPLDYARILDDWADVFGESAIRPRLFEREALIEADVVTDFRCTAGLPALAGKREMPIERNASLKPEAQALLERLTRHAANRPSHRLTVTSRNRLIHALHVDHGGPGRLPCRGEVIDFMSLAQASNERVRSEWFPDRSTLFSTDYSRFPEETTPEPSLDAQLAAAMDAILELIAKPASSPDETLAASWHADHGSGSSDRRRGKPRMRIRNRAAVADE